MSLQAAKRALRETSASLAADNGGVPLVDGGTDGRDISAQDGINESVRVSDPDLYLLWKKCKPVQYKRFYTK
jgi:hypothetical protein